MSSPQITTMLGLCCCCAAAWPKVMALTNRDANKTDTNAFATFIPGSSRAEQNQQIIHQSPHDTEVAAQLKKETHHLSSWTMGQPIEVRKPVSVRKTARMSALRHWRTFAVQTECPLWVTSGHMRRKSPLPDNEPLLAEPFVFPAVSVGDWRTAAPAVVT